MPPSPHLIFVCVSDCKVWCASDTSSRERERRRKKKHSITTRLNILCEIGKKLCLVWLQSNAEKKLTDSCLPWRPLLCLCWPLFSLSRGKHFAYSGIFSVWVAFFRCQKTRKEANGAIEISTSVLVASLCRNVFSVVADFQVSCSPFSIFNCYLTLY